MGPGRSLPRSRGSAVSGRIDGVRSRATGRAVLDTAATYHDLL